MARVRLDNVSKTYEDRGRTVTVVDGVSLEAADGEFLVLVGPSGCGKSTTLRMIAGLESATAGTISIGDRVVTDLPARDRDVAMVFQNYALYPHMSVYRNLAFALTLRKLEREEIDRRVRRAAEMLGLSPLLDRKPRQLSGGQRQRVAVGRAIVREPAVFLFDEPLSNLDAKLRVEMRRQIAELRRSLGTTTVYVTHDQVEAMTMGDRIVVMRAGRVQQLDSPMAVYQRPANTFVASFVGSPSMNLIRGAVTGVNGDRTFVKMGGAFRLPLRAGARYVPEVGRDVILGVRPEAIRLTAPGAGFPARVADLEPLGHETLMTATAGGVELAVRLEGPPPVARGDDVDLEAVPQGLHWFDGGTEGRLGPG